ncbi:hypothetical protein ACP6NG_18165 [Brevibacterium casei]|uniref:hypothetical protein n=1 Tax=Brevibacterium casei TaxID=33889 RepID=UPI003F81F688
MYARIESRLDQKKLWVFFPQKAGVNKNAEIRRWRTMIGAPRLRWTVESISPQGSWITMSKSHAYAVAHFLFLPLGIPTLLTVEQRGSNIVCTESCKGAEHYECVCSCGGAYHMIGLDGPDVLRFGNGEVMVKLGEVQTITHLIQPYNYVVGEQEMEYLTQTYGELINIEEPAVA